MGIPNSTWTKFNTMLPMFLTKYMISAKYGIPVTATNRMYFVDAANGDDDYTGLSPQTALATVQAAEDKCTANRNDTVVLIAGPTSAALAAALAWDKAYTHLIGWGCDLPGMGQRSRIGGSAALDLASLITFSAAGCRVANIQFQNGSDANAAKNAVIVSGNYCKFENCQFSLTHATAASHASSAPLALSGSENTFLNCVIGNNTVLRAGTNTLGELSITGGAGRNTFRDCWFQTYSETAGKFLVTQADSTGVARPNVFWDCLFENFSQNYATTLTDCMDLPTVAGSQTYGVILRGLCQLVGITGWADVATKIHTPGVTSTATYGVDEAPGA